MGYRKDSPESEERRVIRQLLSRKRLGRYEFFLGQREGRRLPGGLEEVSGFVITEHDVAYAFWLSWDSKSHQYVLHPFRAVPHADDALNDDEEYLEARRKLGLDPP